MTESRFVNQNRQAWEEYEGMIDAMHLYSPSQLGEAYLHLCSDLAFAQSHYPDSQVSKYLDALASQYHHVLYRRQPQRWSELWNFFTHDVVLSFYHSRRYLLFSVLLLVFGFIIGALSQHINHDFFEEFFGYGYYSETMNNIRKGNPMGIYGDTPEWEMYLQIALNNIKVGLMFFISGLLSPFYVIYKDMETGVMMGCFDMFFAQQGFGVDALVAPNEHGALEIPACVISCAAGMRLGMGWFFPGKLTRMQALRESAQQALTMALAMIPVFAFAAIIESYITRHQEWPMTVRVMIIIAGLLFITYYVIIMPHRMARKEALH